MGVSNTTTTSNSLFEAEIKEFTPEEKTVSEEKQTQALKLDSKQE